MIKKSLIAAGVACAAILAANVASACDQHPSADAAKTTAKNPACLTQTGSHIRAAAKGCTALGHSYDQTDIARTGASTAGGALRLLDPAITVH